MEKEISLWRYHPPFVSLEGVVTCRASQSSSVGRHPASIWFLYEYVLLCVVLCSLVGFKGDLFLLLDMHV